MYKKQRPKLSVTAVINSAQNPSANWFNGTNGCSIGTGLPHNTNSPTTPANIDLISGNGINYTPNPTNFTQMNTNVSNGSINNGSNFDHQSSTNSNNVLKYPPNHPLSGSKHLCAICGDRASGRHYGLYSCEGCKGFFKRTVRKDLTYACREDRNCIIDKRQRNRCQYCRYQKCLMMGMKREAVQEERQRNKEKNENEVESSTTITGLNSANNFQVEISPEKILNAELKVEQRLQGLTNEDHNFNSYLFGSNLIDDNNNNNNLNARYLLECYQMIEWAKEIPYFTKLPLEDRIALLKSAWNEVLIAGFSHRSMHVKDGIQLAAGIIHRSEAQLANVAGIFDRVLIELVAKMQEIRMDKCELGCLKCIVLLNPEAKGLKNLDKVEEFREAVYSILEKYCRTNYPDQTSRFAKLLLRLPALRSVGLKCVDYLFINKGWNSNEIQMDNYLKYMLERRNYPTSSSSTNVSMNNSMSNNSLIGLNSSSMNSINDNHHNNHHHIANQTLLGLNLSEMSTNNLMNVIDNNNNNLINGNSNSSGFSSNDLSTINSNCINFMSPNSVASTMNNLIMNNGSINTTSGLYLPDLSSSDTVMRNNVSNASANSINNLSMNHSPLGV